MAIEKSSPEESEAILKLAKKIFQVALWPTKIDPTIWHAALLMCGASLILSSRPKKEWKISCDRASDLMFEYIGVLADRTDTGISGLEINTGSSDGPIEA